MKQRFSTRTRLVSALLTLAMVCTFLPFSAFAEVQTYIPLYKFPDETFREYLEQFDKDDDTFLDTAEREAVKEINVANKNISNLYGIQFFPNLEKLDCDQNNLSSLDVSQNPALKYLYCEQNNLSSLDVSSNSALKYLHCTQNNLSSLDVSQNPALEFLLCAQNKLTSLDVSKNEALKRLNCKNNQLTNLNVEYTSIDPSVFLSELLAQDNTYPITVGSDRTFNLSALPGKFEVSKADNWNGGSVNGNTLTVNKGETQVTYTYDCGKGLSETFTLNVTVVPDGSIAIDVSNFPDEAFRNYLLNENLYLTSIKIDQDGDGKLSEAERNAVDTIKVTDGYNGKKLTSLKGIEFFPNLRYLYCDENNLNSLNVSKNKKLEELYCDENNLNSLDVSQNTALLDLNCSQNNLTSLDVRSNAALRYLWCWKNQLTSLDVSKNPVLEGLACKNNQLTSLNVEKTSIDLSNPYSGFDAKNNTYPIAVGSDRTFDLSTLPGFDVTKVSKWVGGTVDGSTLKVDEGATQVTYTYDCGKGCNATFTLNVTVVPDGTVTPPSGGGTGTTTPPSGGGTGTTTPPSGGDGTGTTTPPSGGDGTGTTTPPSGGDGGGGAVIIMAAGAAVAGVVGYGVYNYVSGQKLQALLPEGVAAPENRAQTALLLWNTAGRPEPAEAPAFADVADPDTAKAAQWCVEQGLMKRRLNGKFAPDSSIPAYQVLNAYRKLAGG